MQKLSCLHGFWLLALFLCVSASISVDVRAAVFGSPDGALDGTRDGAHNGTRNGTRNGALGADEGIGDQRISREQATYWPPEFRAVGRLYCADVFRGLAILIQPSEDPYQQNVDAVNSERLAPQILTARHLVLGMDIENCAFAPESDSWRRSAVLSVSRQGVGKDSSSVVSGYANDWSILNLTPWVGWSRHALHLDRGPFQRLSGGAHLVGFDLVTNKMVAHFNCQYGPAEQSGLLKNWPNLYWDNCDSTPGSSGGALFVGAFSELESEPELELDRGNKAVGSSIGQLRLAGIRVGSLFDEIEYGGVPEMGELFDIDKNINVSRAISTELFSP